MIGQDEPMAYVPPLSVPARSDETIGQIARVGEVDRRILERVRHEVVTARTPWVEDYSPYQSGGWWTASLLNASGAGDDVTISDCEPRPTGLLEGMPATKQLLASLQLSYMWVRIARLSPNSFLWEHRDYADLDSRSRVRLHIPLVTNPSAVIVVQGVRVHLRTGHLWRLNPTLAHGAANLIGPDRFHLVIDAYVDTRSTELEHGATLTDSDAQRLPTPSDDEISGFVHTARELAELGFVGSAERYLLRLLYRYMLPEGTPYDLLVDLHQELGDDDRAAHWRHLRAVLLGRPLQPAPSLKTVACDDRR